MTSTLDPSFDVVTAQPEPLRTVQGIPLPADLQWHEIPPTEWNVGEQLDYHSRYDSGRGLAVVCPLGLFDSMYQALAGREVQIMCIQDGLRDGCWAVRAKTWFEKGPDQGVAV